MARLDIIKIHRVTSGATPALFPGEPAFRTVERELWIGDGTNNHLISVPCGVVLPFAAATAPNGYLLCDGAAVSRTTYVTLYALIGTTYGVGDGSTTFNIPDMRQRFPLGKAASGTGSTLGDTGGNIDHTHSADVASTTSGAPSATVEVQSGTGITVATDTHTHATDPASVTSGTANPPFVSLNFIIRF